MAIPGLKQLVCFALFAEQPAGHGERLGGMREGIPMVSSLDVGERFRKQHENVLAAIAQILEIEPELAGLNLCSVNMCQQGRGGSKRRQ
jgi:hypothetical protein